jgi:glycosyltransferase involved in cell wall biosynthesis
MKILLFSKYSRLGASSRLRSYQFLPYLESQGLNITLAPLFGDEYIIGLYTGKASAAVIIGAYLKRIFNILMARNFDLFWIEKELLPLLPAWFELGLISKNIPLVVDYDDAIFHNYEHHKNLAVRTILGEKIDRIMSRADLVIAGNDYLAIRSIKAGARRVEKIPTVVDIKRYEINRPSNNSKLTIGWIGTPWTMRYLFLLEPVLRKIASTRLVNFIAIGADKKLAGSLPIDVRPWHEETEVSEINKFDIGIMPLPDEPFEHGKCGYKLIQYMACGLPVIASPIGINKSLVRHGVDGFHAADLDAWLKALLILCDDAALRKRMGDSGRARIEEGYTLIISEPRLLSLLRSVVS